MSAPLQLLLRDCRLPDGRVADIGCLDGRIEAIGSLAARAAARTIACDGRAVTPGLVDAHIHLDKALLDDRAPSREGSLAEALRVTGEAKRGFTREDISSRARRVLDMAIRQGTTAMRSHVEIDPIVGLTGFEALSALKREYAPAIDVQLCAFAQEGIVKAPGTDALLREALSAGADLVGGVPYVDPDPRRHVDIVFDLALFPTFRPLPYSHGSPGNPAATGRMTWRSGSRRACIAGSTSAWKRCWRDDARSARAASSPS